MTGWFMTDADLMKYCIEFFVFGWLAGVVSLYMGQKWKASRQGK